jgi:hypothetical protein
VCIKPLLDEEAAERQKAWMEEQQNAQVAAGLVVPQPMMAQPQIDLMGSFLPAALLQQYPALAGIDWNSIPQGPPPDEDAYSGRSSFDASSYDASDMSENEMVPSFGNHQNHQQSQQDSMNVTGGLGPAVQNPNHPQSYPSFAGNNTAGDYLSDFEGR